MKLCLVCGQQFMSQISFCQILYWKKQPEEYLCRSCKSKFTKLSQPRCQFCDRELDKNIICKDCQNWRHLYGDNLIHNHAVYQYNQAAHDLMVNYKRYGDFVLAKVLQQLCYLNLKKIHADFYVPLPTSPEHCASRQFDTITSIFDDLVLLTSVLDKHGGLSAQGEKNRSERLKTPQSFFIKKDFKVNLNNKKILLLDDIYTTGRTLYHARDAIIKRYPSVQISSFTIYR
jgi:competence protein ComFC